MLCAPSLAGESFGMVLIEAFAAGTPVIASKIAGYSDVVSDGVDGVLVPPADPQRLAEELQRSPTSPSAALAMGEAGREKAERFAWPRSPTRSRASTSAPRPCRSRSAPPSARPARPGWSRADGGPRRPAQRLPSLEPAPEAKGSRRARTARKIGLGVAGLLGVGLSLLAAHKIGVDNVVASVVRSDVSWVLAAIGLMIASMFMRAASWVSIARAALPAPARSAAATSPRRR